MGDKKGEIGRDGMTILLAEANTSMAS
jgi:hypothetical protein